MKWKCFALMGALIWSAGAGASSLVVDLGNAEAPFRSAALRVSLNQRLDRQRSLSGLPPQPSDPAGAAPALGDARVNGRAAYEEWIKGKTPAQVAEAKKLFAAWLTRLDAMYSMSSPLDVADSPAGAAYTQAVNEFQVDNP